MLRIAGLEGLEYRGSNTKSNMTVIYDLETDTLTIIFSDAQVADRDEIREGTILDLMQMGMSFQWKF